jgi:S-DNA-T family DNA segregation ATPase FtsK/SpoIIIE
MKWAEDLMWKWDLLYIDPTTKFPLRVQAPFVSTEEVDKVVEYLKDKYMQWLSEEQVYDQEIINILNSKSETVWGSDISEEDEELVQKAIEIIKQTRKASATLLQRKLGIWFARAARIMDILEERWIVWPQQWAKPREIYI